MKNPFTRQFWNLGDAQPRMSQRDGGLDRRLKLALTLIFVILLAVVSWAAGSRIQSPAEAAARTAPPTPSAILVPVEKRVLTSDVITRGTARFGLPQSISLATSLLKSAPGVVTGLPGRGDQLEEGDVLLTVSGRPVFVLQGEIPMYRDLFPGLRGADVLQLEGALKRLGFDPGPVDGNFDKATTSAVADWYSSAGYISFIASGEQFADLRILENELAAAVEEKTSAENALGPAAKDGDEAARREVEWLTYLVDRLTQEVEAARQKAYAPVPMDEIVFVSSFPLRVEEIHVKVGDAANGSIMGVTNNQLAIDSSLPLAEAALVIPGMTVAIDEPDLGLQATGVVSRVAETPGTEGADGYHIYFEVLVEETPVPLEGVSLRLTIPVESTSGEVTVVPVSALFLAPDGTSRVQVENNGTLEFIVVKPGLSADGFVEVTPLDGTLSPGQLVLVGYEKSQE
jgi:peptidoglycan hydrolase-like protein with peptidoglycan-binding domain